jgi:DNA processing protein
MKFEEKTSRLMLSRVSGIGPSRFKSICEYFEENTIQIWNLKLPELNKLFGQKIASSIIEVENSFDIEKYLIQLKKREVDFLVLGEDQYPTNLSNIADPPICLYYKGCYEINKLNKSIAVVGTRSNTKYGNDVIKDFMKGLVEQNFSVVSGLAMGVDYLAHHFSLVNKGYTAAVIPTSPDNPVPRVNFGIYNKILTQGGVILSEEDDLKGEIRGLSFAKRNRIVAGITMATLIIEADIKSGALITANNAFDNNRMVFAIPGGIYQQKSQGTNQLIKDNKAKLVQSIDDILVEFGLSTIEKSNIVYKAKNKLEENIIEVLSQQQATPSELSKVLHIDISNINSCISMLEINGAVCRESNGNIKFMI